MKLQPQYKVQLKGCLMDQVYGQFASRQFKSRLSNQLWGILNDQTRSQLMNRIEVKLRAVRVG